MDELIKHLRHQAAIFREEDHRERGASKLEEAADALEAANARNAELESLKSESDDYVDHYRAELEKASVHIAALEAQIAAAEKQEPVAMTLTEDQIEKIAHCCETEAHACPGTNMWMCAHMAVEETLRTLAEPCLHMQVAEVCEDADGYKHIEAVIEDLDDLPKGMKLYAAPLPSDGWRKDAERYRWLRKEHFPTADNPPLAQVVWKFLQDRHCGRWVNIIDGDDLDFAIDDALAKQQGQ